MTIGAPRDRTLRPGQLLAFPVRCSAACDLRISVPGGALRPLEYARTRAGIVAVRFRPFAAAIAPERPGPVRIVVDAGSPGAGTTRRTTRRVRLTRLPAPALARIESVRARRLSGGRVEVRFRTSGPPSDTVIGVQGSRTKGDDGSS